MLDKPKRKPHTVFTMNSKHKGETTMEQEPTFAQTLQQAMNEWNAGTPEQQAATVEAMRKALGI